MGVRLDHLHEVLCWVRGELGNMLVLEYEGDCADCRVDLCDASMLRTIVKDIALQLIMLERLMSD